MRRSVLVSIDDQHLGEITQLVRRLEESGLTVSATLGALGAVSGTADVDNIAALRAIDGVASVEAENDFALPPPDSPVQ